VLADSESSTRLRHAIVRRQPASRCTTAAPSLHARRRTHPTLGAAQAPLHTIIPAFRRRDDTRIGFGHHGGFNQAQAHAQFVADIVDYGLDIQQALEPAASPSRTSTART
jgi:gamma-glutamyltranspeptidase